MVSIAGTPTCSPPLTPLWTMMGYPLPMVLTKGTIAARIIMGF